MADAGPVSKLASPLSLIARFFSDELLAGGALTPRPTFRRRPLQAPIFETERFGSRARFKGCGSVILTTASAVHSSDTRISAFAGVVLTLFAADLEASMPDHSGGRLQLASRRRMYLQCPVRERNPIFAPALIKARRISVLKDPFTRKAPLWPRPYINGFRRPSCVKGP